MFSRASLVTLLGLGSVLFADAGVDGGTWWERLTALSAVSAALLFLIMRTLPEMQRSHAADNAASQAAFLAALKESADRDHEDRQATAAAISRCSARGHRDRKAVRDGHPRYWRDDYAGRSGRRDL